MDLFAAIETRASALKLRDPAPSHEHLQRILQAGGRAPDHGKLAPWRFTVIQGEARHALGELMAQSLKARNPEAEADELRREHNKALRAPCIIAVAAHITPSQKAPEVEQLLAAGAATQNMLLAAHALGYGAMWKTGPAAYNPAIKTALGFASEDHIVALIYIGSIEIAGEPRASVIEERVKWME
jgi:nitroreductase